ncbi:recombinase family protein [Francisella noatunensis]|uniref:Recombinase family protein n=1 Tax=Francisella noatunensis TaxID=657445 RepID=A0A9Q2QJE5_9GAMM|nr:recombinase family protein [Francisella noatunensis]MBK2028519.1 recombinase family protein [Francisella noatunensis]MBK2029189.1 recombinase family protein [Francisella noatunensis]MBK2034055.1 recombinase family protein [Francisella noatunensis]MBK2034736.1 recombinase family protein [Francisella noatunensis]MBK2048974.1 recombinase family protein [Francisella noatunensis]
MNFGYIRVSTDRQNLDSQKNIISRYCVDHKMNIDQWFELEISSRKSAQQRKIHELIDQLNENDSIIVSELSRLGRSIKDVLDIIENITTIKKSRLIVIKQHLDLNPDNNNQTANKILITIFSMLAELERDFISERTKEGLKAVKAQGTRLGKPKGTIQKSMYDKDIQRIQHLYNLGVPIKTIIDTHLKYGKYLSLKSYIDKKIKKNLQPVADYDQICS